MPENILVVEYEPRYAERVRQALAGQPIEASFARDGEEAMRALEAAPPKLIVLSSVVPKISTPDLIRAIRGRDILNKTPILLTVSGYTGSAPKQDAARMGASDILAKPYSESEFLGKVQQLLGVGMLTSNEIFGDLLEDDAIATPGAKKTMSSNKDVDKMVADSLADVMPKKKDPSKAKAPGGVELDKKLQDTLSGLEKSARRTGPGTTAVSPPAAPAAEPPVTAPEPAAAPAPAPRAAAPAPAADRMPISQPVFPAPAAAAPSVEEEPADGVRFGQYVLVEKIATGGMAEVWKARMKGVEGFQKIVAIKKILPHLSDNQEFIEMFVDEAKLAAQLTHNNIIHIYDLGKIANSYYIAMEYVDGYDLKTILNRAEQRAQPLNVELALLIASKVAAALDYAHRKRDFDEKEMGLVHRDVSPQNVLISEDGDIKLCDFGIAKAASKASHTQVGALKGKLQYMSPEQASGKPLDRRSDIFALGTVLFEMLTGRKLFTGDSEVSILEQVREARVQPPSQFNEEVTPEIDRIVLKALEKDQGARYQTAGEMAKDIDSVLYTFRPTPTAADLAIYMHHLWTADAVQHTPVFDAPPAMASLDDGRDLAAIAAKNPKPAAPPRAERVATTTAPGVAMPAWEGAAPPAAAAARPPAQKKNAPVVPIAVAAGVVAIAVGGYFATRGRGTSSATAAQPATRQAANTNALAPAPVPVGTTASAGATDTTLSATTNQSPTLDPNLVNEEVQKRLAAERARLEQQTRNPDTAAAPTPSPVLNRQPVTQPPPVTTQQPPPAVTQTVAPAPPPVQTATEAPAPAPPSEPAQPRVREGDLVQPGTEGLVPARILRRATVPYPPIARQQRVQGTVLLNVLVSETGQVLDVRILRGVSRPVGLNEAAEQMMRRSTFSAPTKDGVRVKAWTTVPVDFKL